ncbi:MAG: hypothetical protein ACOYU0_03335 [Nitrospirota bacterium]
MAKLTLILVNPKNIAFMQKVAEFNNSKVDEGALTVSVSAPKLVIKREWVDEIFGWNDADADFKWRSIIRDHSGKVLKFSDDEIVLADEED